MQSVRRVSDCAGDISNIADSSADRSTDDFAGGLDGFDCLDNVLVYGDFYFFAFQAVDGRGEGSDFGDGFGDGILEVVGDVNGELKLRQIVVNISGEYLFHGRQIFWHGIVRLLTVVWLTKLVINPGLLSAQNSRSQHPSKLHSELSPQSWVSYSYDGEYVLRVKKIPRPH